MENLPKNQKEYYHNKIREFEKRTGKCMNVKGVSLNKIYDTDVEDAKINFASAMYFLNTGKYFVTVLGKLFSSDDYDNKQGIVNFGFAMKNNKSHIYYYEHKKWGSVINIDLFKEHSEWTVRPLPVHMINPVPFLDPGEEYLPYAVENKHIGSNFDDFLKTNNIELKRDINWAIKMLESGKMMSREGNPSLTLFPKKYDHAESTINTEDLFAEDWVVVQSKSFKDVLDDLNAGKTIRRKSWPSDWGVGKYSRYGKIIYLDLIADDWEVVDVVAEVDKIQEDHIKGRK